MKLVIAALAAALATSALAADGAAVYKARCTTCHGKDGKGTTVGQKMGAKEDITKKSPAEVVTVVSNGKGKMTPFKGKLSDEEIDAVAKYVSGGLK